MAKLEIVKDSEGNKIVLIPEILFFNKQNIEWELVEQYLEKYVGEIVEIAETREVVYIGKKFPDEYSGSLYTRKSKGARAKAKANAAQGIMEMIEIAAQKVFCENRKEKHSQDAQKGWYYYHTRFAWVGQCAVFPDEAEPRCIRKIPWGRDRPLWRIGY